MPPKRPPLCLDWPAIDLDYSKSPVAIPGLSDAAAMLHLRFLLREERVLARALGSSWDVYGRMRDAGFGVGSARTSGSAVAPRPQNRLELGSVRSASFLDVST